MRLGLALAVIGAGLTFYIPPSGAGCAGPEVAVDRRRARPGETVVVTGQFWFDGCNDTGGGSCFGPSPSEEVETPIEGIDVDIKRKGSSRKVRVVENVDADERFRFEAAFAVPSLPPGRYVLVANQDAEVPLRIRR